MTYENLMRFRISTLAVVFMATSARAQDLNEALEKATKDAVRKVSPVVVQIVTQGGADLVVTTPKGPPFARPSGPPPG